MNRKRTRRTVVMRMFCASLVAAAALSFTAHSALATPENTGLNENFFNLSSGTINAGGSISASAQFSLSNPNSSGGAGTTTRTFNGNTVNFVGSGSAQGSSSGSAGGGGTSQTFSSGSLTYYTPGVYSVSIGGSLSWHNVENSSYGLGGSSQDSSLGYADNRLVTVLNVAPQSVTLGLVSATINQGTHGAANMTATSPGTDQLTFTANGNISSSYTDPNTTPGSTRSASGLDLGQYNVPGVYTITGSVTDNFGGSTNAPNALLTVLNLPPILDSLSIFSRVPVINGASDMISFQATAHDPGGDALTFAWNLSGAGGPYNDQVGNNPTVPVQYFIGTHTIGVQVSDPYGGTVTGSLVFTVIPEPATLAMLGVGGAIGLVMFRRRKRC